jgi:5-methylcytosine-specific restriction endonuclease McrA
MSYRRRFREYSKATRAIILDRHGWVCNYCFRPIEKGAIFFDSNLQAVNAEVRAAVGSRVVSCGVRAVATLDHVVPIEHGGTNEVENIVLACSDCNAWKHTKPVERFEAELATWIAEHAWELETLGYFSATPRFRDLPPQPNPLADAMLEKLDD